MHDGMNNGMRPSVLMGLMPVICCASSGCGLLHIPHIEKFPSRSLKRVTVRDADNGALVTDATVSFTMTRWENWLRPHARWGIIDERLVDSDGSAISEGVVMAVVSWEAVAESPGFYSFSPEARWVSRRVWFPLPPVLGSAVYKSYHGTVTVSAPGHKTVWVDNGIENHAAWIADCYSGENDLRPATICVQVDEDGVTVLLPRRGSTADEPRS